MRTELIVPRYKSPLAELAKFDHDNPGRTANAKIYFDRACIETMARQASSVQDWGGFYCIFCDENTSLRVVASDAPWFRCVEIKASTIAFTLENKECDEIILVMME